MQKTLQMAGMVIPFGLPRPRESLRLVALLRPAVPGRGRDKVRSSLIGLHQAQMMQSTRCVAGARQILTLAQSGGTSIATIVMPATPPAFKYVLSE